MGLEIVCFGALNVDKLYRVNEIAKEGEERSITEFKETPGGSAGNTATGLARLGIKVGYIGKVSNDREGKILLGDFTREGVNTDGIVISQEGRSGTVLGFIDREGERALYVDPGVNDSLEFKDIDLEYVRSTKFIHLTSFVGKKPFAAQEKLVTMVHDDVNISLDPGDIYARKGLTSLKPIIERCYAIIPNENEVKMLTGKGYKRGSRILLKEGASIVAVKLGKRGCYVSDGKESHLIEPYKVKVIDTTGAGDAFCAGFLYGLNRNKDLYESGKIGNFVASRCIREVGARAGLPCLMDFEL